MNACRCRDEKMHAFYTSPRAFRWRWWPKIDLGLRPTDRRTRLVLNRYPHHVIGVAMCIRGRGVGLRWKRTP